MYKVSDTDAGTRLDAFLAASLNVSRTKAKQLIDLGAVCLAGEVIQKPSLHVEEGMEITVDETIALGDDLIEEAPLDAFPVRLVHEDATYIVVEKPAGLLVHETGAQEKTTLVAWLLKRYPEIADVGEGKWRAGIVHRLDRLASGLLVIARTEQMHTHLKRQFQERTMEKEYLVLVHGEIEADHDIIDFPIDRGNSGRMVSRPHIKEVTLKNVHALQPGKEARTEYWVMRRFVNATLLRVKIHTGRTHQIRVHMHAYGHPVVGDTLYFQRRWMRTRSPKLNRLFLHAAKLGFVDLAGEMRVFDAPLPEELDAFLGTLKSF